MSGDVVRDARVKAVISYFEKADARDPSILDLFTDDVQFCFPKFGLVQGKAAIARFGQVMAGYLERLEHDIDGFNYIVSGDFIVVEGSERGVTRRGEHWPDGVISQGRFCNVFQFEGDLIRRVHVYVDPDFTSSDHERIRLFRGEAAGGA